jgi:hypothetical protein
MGCFRKQDTVNLKIIPFSLSNYQTIGLEDHQITDGDTLQIQAGSAT